MLSRLLAACVCLIFLLPCGASALSAQQESNPSNRAQSAEPAPLNPTFHAESRQVLVQANVWNPGAEKHAANLLSKPGQQAPKGWPTPARGLTMKDFHVFDNGVEQKITFLKELDFDEGWSDPWYMELDTRGTWGIYGPEHGIDATATYLIGYAPPSLQPGECRAISVVVEGHQVDLNRTQYCNLEVQPKTALKAEAAVDGSQTETLADSHGPRRVKVSIQAFSFWSSGVLRLLREPPSQSDSSVEPGSDYTYVVQVHDARAPATVQIATEFHWPNEDWDEADCFRKNPSIHILGTVNNANGEVETQFNDSISCLNPSVMRSTNWKYAAKHGWFGQTVRIPTRFDTQVELRPGDYDLRVVVTDGTSFGRAQLPLHVQAFDGRDLGISNVVLGGIVRDASWVPREAASVYPAPIIPTPLVSKGVEFFPATNNRVPKRTPVSLYFEIYEPLLEADNAAVSFSVRITDLKTNSLVMNTGPLSVAKWVMPGNVVIPIGIKLNIEKLKRGSYRLEVQASDSAGRETAWRQTTLLID